MRTHASVVYRSPRSHALRDEWEQTETESLSLLPPPPTATPAAMSWTAETMSTSATEYAPQPGGTHLQPQAPFPQVHLNSSTETTPPANTNPLMEAASLTFPQMPSPQAQMNSVLSVTMYTMPSGEGVG